MSIKCESCRFFDKPNADAPSESARCLQVFVQTQRLKSGARGWFTIDKDREICDREGNGHFVYFEPTTPTAGAAFAGESRAEFERDRMGQTGKNNAAAMKATAAGGPQ